MNNFEKLQDSWKNQPDSTATERDFESLLTNVRAISNKQRIMNVVLSITILVLLGFVFYVSGYKNATFLTGISLMIGSLIIRIVVEAWSTRRLNKMNFLERSTLFKQQLLRYYGNRRKIHYILTPLCIAVYCIGFGILLPLFKASLSYGFYLYILLSAIVFLLVFLVFIIKQVKIELRKLRQLQD